MNHSLNMIATHESSDIDIIYISKILNMIVIYEFFNINIIYILKSQNTLDFHDLSKNRSPDLQLLSIYIRKVILDLLLFDFDEKYKNVLTRKQ